MGFTTVQCYCAACDMVTLTACCSIKKHNRGEIVPPVMHQCVSYLRKHGEILVILCFALTHDFWKFTPIVCSWSITDTDLVLCASEDCVILQSIWNTSIAPLYLRTLWRYTNAVIIIIIIIIITW